MTIEPDTKDWTWVLERSVPRVRLRRPALDRAGVPQAIRDNATLWEVVLDTDGRRGPALEQRVVAARVRLPRPRRQPALRPPAAADARPRTTPAFDNWDQDAAAEAGDYGSRSPRPSPPRWPPRPRRSRRRTSGVRREPVGPDRAAQRRRAFTVDTFARYHLHDLVHHAHDVSWVDLTKRVHASRPAIVLSARWRTRAGRGHTVTPSEPYGGFGDRRPRGACRGTPRPGARGAGSGGRAWLRSLVLARGARRSGRGPTSGAPATGRPSPSAGAVTRTRPASSTCAGRRTSPTPTRAGSRRRPTGSASRTGPTVHRRSTEPAPAACIDASRTDHHAPGRGPAPREGVAGRADASSCTPASCAARGPRHVRDVADRRARRPATLVLGVGLPRTGPHRVCVETRLVGWDGMSTQPDPGRCGTPSSGPGWRRRWARRTPGPGPTQYVIGDLGGRTPRRRSTPGCRPRRSGGRCGRCSSCPASQR